MSALSSATSTRAPARDRVRAGRQVGVGERPRRGGRVARQPAQRLLDVRQGADARRRQLPRHGDPIGRQMRRAGGNRDGERGALAFAALHAHVAAVQPGELVHQGQPDAGAFVRARLRMLHPVEALEHPRQVGRGDADAGVGDLQLGVRRRASAARRESRPRT